MRRTGPAGFTLIELVISMTVLAILGAAAMRMLGGSARLNERQEAAQRSRAVIRGAAARLSNELRAVPVPWPGMPVTGIELATADSVQARVPYALAVFCDLQSGVATFSVLPRDTAISRFSEHAGLLVRADPEYFRWAPTPSPTAGTAARCTGTPGIQTLPGGTVVQLPAPAGGALATALAGTREGQTVHFVRRVRYVFRRGARTALVRVSLSESGATLSSEELAAPFDAASRFNYVVGGYATPRIPASSELSIVYGITALLRSSGDETVRDGGPTDATFATTIMLQNVPR